MWQTVMWLTICQTPEIGEGDTTTDVDDAQLGVYKAYTAHLGWAYTQVFTLRLIHRYLWYGLQSTL